jgi:uncharacterized membrane protein
MPAHYCCSCGSKVCSSCIDEDGVVCRRCRAAREEHTGFGIGYAPLRRMVNVPLFVAAIAAIVIGIVMISWASSVPAAQPGSGGVIYIFPFPFAFAWGSPDMAVAIPLIIAAVVLPITIMILVFRRMARI